MDNETIKNPYLNEISGIIHDVNVDISTLFNTYANAIKSGEGISNNVYSYFVQHIKLINKELNFILCSMEQCADSLEPEENSIFDIVKKNLYITIGKAMQTSDMLSKIGTTNLQNIDIDDIDILTKKK